MSGDDEGLLTDEQSAALEAYATRWAAQNERDLDIERAHPELADEFYAVRTEPTMANGWKKSAPKRTPLVLVKS
jgi:hypothetical protein